MPSHIPGVHKRSLSNDREREQFKRFRQEYQRLRNRANNVSFVNNESFIQRERWIIDQTHVLGSGSWWQMFRASYADDPRDFAVKVIRIDDLPPVYQHCVSKDHLQLYSAFQHPVLAIPSAVYKTDTNLLYIFIELSAHKTFMSKYLESNRIGISEAKKIGRSFAKGLEYLHGMGIAHSNCTCNNIVMDRQFHVKLFGLEYFHQSYDLAGHKHLSCLPYRPSPYLPPEVLETPIKPYDPLCVDIWFYGCSLAFMVSRQYPFGDEPTRHGIIEKIENGSWAQPDIDDKLRDLLSRVIPQLNLIMNKSEETGSIANPNHVEVDHAAASHQPSSGVQDSKPNTIPASAYRQIRDRLIISYASGLGYGTMSGLFAFVNVLVDSLGPATTGLHGDSQYFFIVSAITTLAFILMNVSWSILTADSIERSDHRLLAFVVGTHLLATASLSTLSRSFVVPPVTK
ncbi:Gamma-secretase subunit Aph-1b, partial [Fragariocoptes setiger]